MVVVHNNTLETFYDEKQQDNYQPKTTSFVLPESNDTSSESNAAIFDNDSFWSGSISWYWYMIYLNYTLYTISLCIQIYIIKYHVSI